MKSTALLSLVFVFASLSTAQAQIDPQACKRPTQNGYLVQNLYSQSEVSVLTLDGANQIFEHLKRPEYRIPYLAAERNCELRAHKMSHLMYTRMGGIKSLKVLIQAKGIMQVNGSFVPLASLSGYSQVTGQNHPWSYHTAPALCVRANGKDELFVIDPSLFDRPVPYNQWKSQITAGIDSTLYSESSYGMYNIASETEYGVKTSFDLYDLERTEELLRRDWSEHQSLLRQR